MFINSYLIAFFSGAFIYLIMIIDSIYIDPIKTNKNISPKIPLLVMLLVWIICIFQQNNLNIKSTCTPTVNQDIFLDPF